MSRASFSFSSTIWSLDSSTSTESTVSGSRPNAGRKSSVWHMVSRSTITSMGRPEGALKYICRSPLRLLNRRSGSQPLSASQAATSLRPLDRQAKSMSWSRRSRGGKSGHSTRTASPPSSFRPSPASAAALGQPERLGQRIVRRIRRCGSSAGSAMPGLLSSLGGARGDTGGPAQFRRTQRDIHVRPVELDSEYAMSRP